jgi:hypothetical protein
MRRKQALLWFVRFGALAMVVIQIAKGDWSWIGGLSYGFIWGMFEQDWMTIELGGK